MPFISLSFTLSPQGNHEADIDHRTTCRHVKDWYKAGGIWINSNMQSHEAMEYQVPYHVVELTVPGQPEDQKFRVGFIAVLSNDPKLYSQFKAPGAFGGATIEDPWETLKHYEHILRHEEHCDVIIPLEHLYLHENQITCEKFGPDVFPVILSGHDHHRVDTKVHGTRIIKPGMDAVYATVLEIVFHANKDKPTIRSNFVDLSTYEPDPDLKVQTDAAYDVLLPLRNTQLADILPQFKPLSSHNARGSLTTMGKLICSMLKAAIEQTVGHIDAVILMGGNIRANFEYDDDAFFSLETLESEVKADEVVGFVDMPGRVLAAGIEATHSGEPIPGWFQYDDGIREVVAEDGGSNDDDGEAKHQHPYKTIVTTVNNQPIEPDRMYRVVTKIKDLTNGQSPPLKEYYQANPGLLPSKGEYYNIHSELMGFFARGLFRKLWEATEELMAKDPMEVWEEASHPPPPLSEIEGRLRHAVLDRDGDGKLSVEDIHVGLRDLLGLSVNDEVKTLATAVHACADTTGDGKVTVQDFKVFCTKMPREYRLPRKWSDAFPDPLPTPTISEVGSNNGSGGGDDATSTPDPIKELEVFEEHKTFNMGMSDDVEVPTSTLLLTGKNKVDDSDPTLGGVTTDVSES
jgi:2',3'-cyclic-nucleotide 2'-phosphodiesterase (5'-nucleotidase family)